MPLMSIAQNGESGLVREYVRNLKQQQVGFSHNLSNLGKSDFLPTLQAKDPTRSLLVQGRNPAETTLS